MPDFRGLGTVLKRCGLSGIVNMVYGPPAQLEMRNTRAMEVLKGMMKQEENRKIEGAMRAEWEFLRARARYLKTGKLKKSLLKRAVYNVRKDSADPAFTKFMELRAEAFVEYASKKTDKETVEKMNEIVEKIPEKALRNIFRVKSTSQAEILHSFEGVQLVFRSEKVLAEFAQGNYREVIRQLKSAEDFDSQVICALSKVEKFQAGMLLLEGRNTKASRRTLERYMTQWNALYAQTVDLFATNFMDEEYLHKINRKVAFNPLQNSILFHPVTYDISSMYIRMPQEKPPSPAGISGMLSRMSLFGRK
ncbi:uncharacterized protein NEMAJ01_2388 [Nematocida major]|uniref:uncharacterized protein n=1 Tax=Nematocida major TaxID=1912982 RepID=UPI0020087845|nr:uncharacterized protein NEMAJ01_2388 [Nematocida major]KAH9387492.1 hypothetical protein NEMAJ01_2388 [Nematocida major]